MILQSVQLYKGETHLSYYPRLVTDGFPAVLPPAMILGAAQAKLPEATLAKYVGDYRLADGRTFKIIADKEGFLNGRVSGLPADRAAAERSRQVSMCLGGPAGDLNVTFDATGAKRLVGVYGGTLRGMSGRR